MRTGKQRSGRSALVIVLMVVCVGLAACGGSTSSQAKGASAGAGSGRTGPLRSDARLKRASMGAGTAAVRGALTKFAACLHRSGVDVPISRSSRGGAALDIKGIDTSGTRFKAAWVKCRGAVDMGRAFHKFQAGVRPAT
jgi:hypothetical protein